MMPTVTQTLATMRRTVEQTIVPALPPDHAFAQEQAGLIMATLDWLVDVHESEYGIELADNEDLRACLTDLGRTVAPLPPAGDFAALREQTRALKAEVAAAVADGDAATRERVLQVAERQGRREQAWFRMTGFPEDVPGDIATTLRGDR